MFATKITRSAQNVHVSAKDELALKGVKVPKPHKDMLPPLQWYDLGRARQAARGPSRKEMREDEKGRMRTITKAEKEKKKTKKAYLFDASERWLSVWDSAKCFGCREGDRVDRRHEKSCQIYFG